LVCNIGKSQLPLAGVKLLRITSISGLTVKSAPLDYRCGIPNAKWLIALIATVTGGGLI
jgi:hypothetical protein